jgi:hypothetical protein
MAKVVENYEFKTPVRLPIPHQEEWYDGQKWRLTPKDLGRTPDTFEPEKLILALKKYAKDNYGKRLLAELHENGTDLMIKAVD